MSPRERALLLQRGVTLTMIEALEAAGHDSLRDVHALTRQQLADVPGLDERAAVIVRRGIGLLADIGVTELRAAQ